jgi:hypothetical protein
MTESIRTAARRLSAPWLAKGYVPTALHEYRSAHGITIYWRIRLEHRDGNAAPEGRKIIRPIKLNGSGYTLGEPDFPDGKPLYNLDRIAANPAAPVWIVEGEKAADALTKLGVIATTSGGTDSAGRADWAPLRGRDCRLWRDNDDAGEKYADDVATILSGLGCRLSSLDIDRLALPPKGDAWDWCQTHRNATPADVEALPRAELSSNPADRSPDYLGGVRVELIRGDTIIPESVRWIWSGWLAAGKFHILAGCPGAGKTTLAMALAATISSGGTWPDGSPAEHGNVLIWSGEDDPSDTLAPRLIVNGADMSRIYFVGESRDPEGKPVSFDPARHIAALESAATDIGNIRLLVIDPVVSAVGGDGNSNTEVRRALQPIVDFAATLDCAALGISHFTKGSKGRDVVERVTGSLAFGATARVVLVAARLNGDRDGVGDGDGDRDGVGDNAQVPGRIVARAKSNIGPDADGFGYDLVQIELPDFPGVFASRVLWSGAIAGTARELLRQAEVDAEGDSGGSRQFLRQLLAEGPMRAVDVFREAEAHGYNKRQMQRARKRLGIKSEKAGMRGGWTWRPPGDTASTDQPAEDAEDADVVSVAPSASSCGTFMHEGTAPDSKIREDAGHNTAAPSEPSASDWRVTRASGETFEVRTVPAATLSEMREMYLDATIVPIRSDGA